LIWRIRGRQAFQNLARNGRRTRTQTLWCSFVNDPTAVPLRVAFSIGRAVGPATTRNRLRRRLRAIMSSAAPRAGLDSGWLLIGARPAAVKQTFDALGREIETLLHAIPRGGGDA
jgi:ribonuclease P protein component